MSGKMSVLLLLSTFKREMEKFILKNIWKYYYSIFTHALAFHRISRCKFWHSLESVHGLNNFFGTTKPFSSSWTWAILDDMISSCGLLVEFLVVVEVDVIFLLSGSGGRWFRDGPLILNCASFNSWTTASERKKKKIKKLLISVFVWGKIGSFLYWKSCFEMFFSWVKWNEWKKKSIFSIEFGKSEVKQK